MEVCRYLHTYVSSYIYEYTTVTLYIVECYPAKVIDRQSINEKVIGTYLVPLCFPVSTNL